MDVSSLCRSCMKEVASWEKENFDKRAIEMFCFCTQIMITEGDKLPKQFCYDCFIKIESSYIFIKEAQKVHNTLKNIVSRSQTSIIIKTESHITQNQLKNGSSNEILLDCDFGNAGNPSNLFDNEEEPENDTTYAEVIPEYLKKEETFCANQNMPLDRRKGIETNQIEKHTNTTSINNKNIQEKAILQVEQKEKTKNHICPICSKAFAFKTWLDRHSRKLHNEHNNSKLPCEHCPKTFAKESQLKEHLWCHTEQRCFGCGVCDARFKRRKELTAHARTHSNHRNHACLHCGKTFKQKSVLRTHMMLHENKKTHLCTVCGWSFVQACNLVAHMRRHTGEKPYSCAECTFTCAFSSSLKRHALTHRGLRKHQCKHCKQAFYDRSGLARHTRTHTGELPFKCPYCSQAFVDSWKRKSHLMRQHKLTLKDIPAMPRDPQRDTLTE